MSNDFVSSQEFNYEFSKLLLSNLIKQLFENQKLTPDQFKVLISEISECCGYSISHEDYQGAFEIVDFNSVDDNRLLEAFVKTKEKKQCRIID